MDGYDGELWTLGGLDLDTLGGGPGKMRPPRRFILNPLSIKSRCGLVWGPLLLSCWNQCENCGRYSSRHYNHQRLNLRPGRGPDTRGSLPNITCVLCREEATTAHLACANLCWKVAISGSALAQRTAQAISVFSSCDMCGTPLAWTYIIYIL